MQLKFENCSRNGIWRQSQHKLKVPSIKVEGTRVPLEALNIESSYEILKLYPFRMWLLTGQGTRGQKRSPVLNSKVLVLGEQAIRTQVTS